jgi:hypothetical protein
MISHARAAVWGGGLLLVADAALVMVHHACLHACTESWVFALGRLRFLVHPIAERLYVQIVLAFFDGKERWLHQWTPTDFESARDFAVLHGLGLLEAGFRTSTISGDRRLELA